MNSFFGCNLVKQSNQIKEEADRGKDWRGETDTVKDEEIDEIIGKPVVCKTQKSALYRRIFREYTPSANQASRRSSSDMSLD